jgi:hypothetical protein
MRRTPTSPGFAVIPPSIEVHKNRMYLLEESAECLYDPIDRKDFIINWATKKKYFFSRDYFIVSDKSASKENISGEEFFADLDDLAQGLHRLGFRDTAGIRFPDHYSNSLDVKYHKDSVIKPDSLSPEEQASLDSKIQALIPKRTPLKLIQGGKSTRP